MKCKSYLFLLLGFLVFSLVFIPLSAKENEEEVRLEELKSQHPSTSERYRGVVVMDANNGGLDEIYCDFGVNGIWSYNGSWTKLNSSNPSWMFGFKSGTSSYLVADFASLGLWRWDYNGTWKGTWTKISNSNAVSGFAVDDDNDGDQELHIDFGSTLGLWRYDMGDATKWVKINSLSPEHSFRSDFQTVGHEEGVHDFGSNGLWINWSKTTWFKISSSNAGDDNISADIFGDTSEEIVVDFGGLGLWVYDYDASPASRWNKLASSGPIDIKAVQFGGNVDYELLVAFNSAPGLWYWNWNGSYPGAWTKINASSADYDAGFCEPFDPDHDTWDEVAVDFGSLGLWKYENDGGVWTKLSNSNPQFMVACNHFFGSDLDDLVVDFGALGLWIYNGNNGSWSKINALSPDGVN